MDAAWTPRGRRVDAAWTPRGRRVDAATLLDFEADRLLDAARSEQPRDKARVVVSGWLQRAARAACRVPRAPRAACRVPVVFINARYRDVMDEPNRSKNTF